MNQVEGVLAAQKYADSMIIGSPYRADMLEWEVTYNAHLAGQEHGRKEALRWRRYPEEKPEKVGGVAVELYLCFDGEGVFPCYWDSGEWLKPVQLLDDDPLIVLAWMPLPAPPEKEEG